MSQRFYQSISLLFMCQLHKSIFTWLLLSFALIFWLYLAILSWCLSVSKIVELEEELRVVGNNLKSLELSEEKALEREDTFTQQIREQTQRLKEVKRGIQADRNSPSLSCFVPVVTVRVRVTVLLSYGWYQSPLLIFPLLSCNTKLIPTLIYLAGY